MKKFLALALVSLIAAMPMMAQRHNYGSVPSNRYDYERSHSRWVKNYYGKDLYFGVRIGPAFSHVSGESGPDAAIDATSSRTGLHLGAVAGFELTNRAPVFFETGISFVRKGGKGHNIEGHNITADLNYLELPLTFKYIHYTDFGLSIHPFVGGYLACGVGGKIKDYDKHYSENSYSNDNYKLFDGGLRLGCGVGFSMFYLDVAYDIGLANISHNTFDSNSNRTLYMNFGVNF